MSLKRKKKLRLIAVVSAIALLLFSIIPIRIAIAFYQAPQPQAIFVLGGDFARTYYAAQVWQTHREMDVWVSDFSANLDQQHKILTQADVPASQIHLDGQATDTVTNFTTLVNQFSEQKLQHLFLITSDFHMRRASAIATIVLGSRGIIVTPLPLSSTQTESRLKVPRDMMRSILWLVTGRAGAGLNPNLQQLID